MSLTDVAQILEFKGKLDEACEAYETILKGNLKTIMVFQDYLDLAQCYAKANRLEDAKKAFEGAIEHRVVLDSIMARPRLEYAAFLETIGSHKEAYEQLCLNFDEKRNAMKPSELEERTEKIFELGRQIGQSRKEIATRINCI